MQDSYGPKGAKSGRTTIAVGAIYSSALGRPLLVCGQTKVASDPSAFPSTSGQICSATHLNPVQDSFTGYAAPGGIEFTWGDNKVQADLKVNGLGITEKEGGLIEKVDVLAEIPYVIRKTLAAVTGTKPYIYQVCLLSGVFGQIVRHIRLLDGPDAWLTGDGPDAWLTGDGPDAWLTGSISTKRRSTSRSKEKRHRSKAGSSTRRLSSRLEQSSSDVLIDEGIMPYRGLSPRAPRSLQYSR
jgi:hypothetical protein